VHTAKRTTCPALAIPEFSKGNGNVVSEHGRRPHAMSRDTAAVGLEFADLRRDVVDNISWLPPFDWSVAYEHPYETGPLRQLLRHSELAIPLAQSISRIPSQFLRNETQRHSGAHRSWSCAK
jgi:hypothetical protein